MVFNPDNWKNKIIIKIDKNKIDTDLINFPVSIVLSSGTGITGYDSTDVFYQLTPSSDVDQYTKLMLHCTGDRSDYKNIITNVGNPQITSTTFSGFTSCMYFDGAGDRIRINASSLWDFNTEDFTVDWWEYRITSSASESTCATDYAAAGVRGLLAGHDDGAGNLNVYMSSNGSTWDIAVAKSLGPKSLNQWVHFAVVRSGNTFYTFKDGIQKATWTSSLPLYYNNTDFSIGAHSVDKDFNGYIRGFRITKGEALWTSDFSSNLPAWPYTTNSGTKLLLGFDGDTSASGHSLNFIGSPRFYSNKGPFDGSYYFDGGTAYITVNDHDDHRFGSDNFTVDWWEYRTLSSDNKPSICANSTSTYPGYIFGWSSGGNLVVDMSSNGSSWDIANAVNMGSIDVNIWTHWAISRNGNNFYTFKNGDLTNNFSSSLSVYPSTGGLSIGRYQSTYYFPAGYMASIRVSKGVARWTSDFTPPQQPYGHNWHNRKKIAPTTTISGIETELYTEIEDWSDGYFSVYPKTFSTSTVKATTYFDATYYPHFAVDPSKSLTGSITNNSWASGSGQHSNQKFNVDLREPTIIKRILLHNACHLGTSYTENGIYNFSIYGTNSATAFNNTTYSDVTDLILLGTFQARQHILEDIEDSQYFYLDNNNAYRYYVLRIADDFGGGADAMVIRYIEFQEYIKKAVLWTKVPTVYSGTDTDLTLYYDSTQTTNSGYIGDPREVPAQNVWDDDFVAVYHMNQDPSGGTGCVLDSTSYGHNGTPSNMVSNDLIGTGVVGKALSFNGSNKYITITDTDPLDLNSGGYTIESHINTNVSTRGGVVGKLQTGGSFYGWMIDYSFPTANKLALFANESSSSWEASDTAITYDTWEYFVATSDGKYYLDASPDGTHTQTATPAVTSQDVWLGRNYNNNYFNGFIDEIRVSKTARSHSWIKATHYSNFNQLLTFSSYYKLIFYFSDPIPAHLSTVYGLSKQLKLTVTISGEDAPYIYDAAFYDGLDNQIGSTISGTDSGQFISVVIPTTSGAVYNWYVEASTSGLSDTSSTYQFTNKFLCEGYVEDQGVRTSGIPIRLHRRSNGEVIGNDISSTISGTFAIETDYNEEHYIVALHTDSDYNALIYDRITP